VIDLSNVEGLIVVVCGRRRLDSVLIKVGERCSTRRIGALQLLSFFFACALGLGRAVIDGFEWTGYWRSHPD